MFWEVWGPRFEPHPKYKINSPLWYCLPVTDALACLFPGVQALTYALKIFNYFFTAVFILELTMKLVALGVRIYLKDKWNQLDVGIVILSVIGIVLEELESKIIPINPTIIRVMRVLRIARGEWREATGGNLKQKSFKIYLILNCRLRVTLFPSSPQCSSSSRWPRASARCWTR